MGKHIIDRPRDRNDGARAEHYAKIEREQGETGPHPTTTELQRRQSEAGEHGERAKAFVKVERGETA